MLRPKRVAIIGASERNPFSAPIITNLDAFGYAGDLLLVNPRGEPVAGRATLRSAAELDGEIDVAYVCVPSDQVADVIGQAADAGAKSFIVVSSGFAETGAEGALSQAKLRAVADAHGALLLGPNSLGFINYVDGVPLCSLPANNRRGTLGIASVSGSVGAYIAKVARLQGVGLSHVVLAGNEAGVTMADIIDFLVDDPDTHAIGAFLETIHDPAGFARAAERAMKARKPIVLLKAGSSENTAKLAAAHTGALVGDDKVFDAVARELGICRVDSYEDVVATAVLLEKVGPVAAPGVAALTISGGSGEILSDLGGAAGISFPPFAEAVRAEIEGIVSGFGQTHNPLDLTGAALRYPDMWERLLTAIAKDAGIGLALCLWDVPAEVDAAWQNAALASIARGYAAFPAVPPLIGLVTEPVTDHGRETIAAAGLPGAITGLKAATAALQGLRRWSDRLLDPRPVSLLARAETVDGARPRGERAMTEWLANRGVPVTPSRLASDADAAADAARALGYPVALKISAPGIAHKSEVAGVALGIADETALREAFARMMAAAPAGAGVEGVLVAPMRRQELELLVSVSNDPVWGPMLVLGIGGIWVELFEDSAMLPLPVTPDRVIAALRGLKAARLFDGYRGRPKIAIAPVADAIVAIAEAALALGPELVALEINPLAIMADSAEVMDALAIWSDEGA